MINKEILRLAAPSIVSNVTTPLLGLVDTAITGHMGAPVFLAAIAVGGSMFSLAYWVMNFLRMGTSGLTAQSYGENLAKMADEKDCKPQLAILAFSLAVSLALSVILLCSSRLIADGLLYFIDADGATSLCARTYFSILIYGAPAVLATFVLTGWFLGMQNSKAPMWIALAVNISNIAASLVLVYVFKLKIEGIAMGTLISQYLGLLLGLGIAKRRYGLRLASIIDFKQLKERAKLYLKKFFSVNTDIFLRTLCLVAVTLWFTRSGAKMGTMIVSANALLMQLFILFSYFMDGFAFAGEALAGKYWGMKDRTRLMLTIKGIFKWGLAVAVLFTATYAFCGKGILQILTDEPGVVNAAMQYSPWAIAIPMAGVMAFVWDGIFIGLTFTRQMLMSMACATATYFLAYYALVPSLGNHGLWLAFLLYLVIRGAVETLLFLRQKV